MKNKLMLVLLCALLVIGFCSCGLFGDQRYVCEIDDVQSIKIVQLEEYVEGEYRFEYTDLCTISEHAIFVEQLNNLKHSVNWGDPGRLYTGYIVILITYSNGDFDLLYRNAQWFNRSGINQNGYFFFDETQFQALISAYWADTP